MNKILDILYKEADSDYKKFNAKLIPNVNIENIIGVKIPIIRRIAKEIYNSEECVNFLNDLPHKYLEENILHSCLISLNNDYDLVINELDEFLPYIDNWSVCDTLKPKVLINNKEKTYIKIKEWIKSKDTYMVRFAITILLNYYLDEDFKDEYNDLVMSIKTDEYYINMAIAWYFSFALIKQYNRTIKIIESKKLSKFIQNKSIQKAIESKRINDEIKEYLRSLKKN